MKKNFYQNRFTKKNQKLIGISVDTTHVTLLVLLNLEDIDMEGIEELEENEDLDKSHEYLSQHDQFLNLILDIEINNNFSK